MNARYYHTPVADPGRKRCPVCQYPVYSLAGVHPQCAVLQADPPRSKGKVKVSPRQDEPTPKDGAVVVVVEALIDTPIPDSDSPSV
jgi:hypothetical protein